LISVIANKKPKKCLTQKRGDEFCGLTGLNGRSLLAGGQIQQEPHPEERGSLIPGSIVTVSGNYCQHPSMRNEEPFRYDTLTNEPGRTARVSVAAGQKLSTLG
jgi:hypothetical protein